MEIKQVLLICTSLVFSKYTGEKTSCPLKLWIRAAICLGSCFEVFQLHHLQDSFNYDALDTKCQVESNLLLSNIVCRHVRCLDILSFFVG